MVNCWAYVAILFTSLILIELLRMNYVLYRVLRKEPKLILSESTGCIPLLTIVIPAKNEEANLERTVLSLTKTKTVNLEIILVDDRSTDNTLALMNRLAQSDRRIKVLHIDELPQGWTGKTHAMHVAVEHAHGDVLLFTDADAVFEPGLLESTICYFQDENLDLLTMLPGFTSRGFYENVVHIHLALGFSYFHPISEVNDPTYSTAMASGCFMMICRQAYDSTGGWKSVRQEVTEDVAYSKILKRAGKRIRLLRGSLFVKTKPFTRFRTISKFWSRTFYGGLEKSIPKISRLLVNYAVLTAISMMFVASAALELMGYGSVANIILLIVSGAATAAVMIPTGVLLKQDGASPIYGLTSPIGMIIGFVITLETVYVILFDRGIRWRGSLYK